ncbi:hypothetical protein OK016_07545 [Vibrio chagasii]|nr:hypothetical protein [Vibrio chagasii]
MAGMNWARKFLAGTDHQACSISSKEILAVGEQVWVRHEAITGDEVSEEATEESATASLIPVVWRLSQVPNANTLHS